MLAHLPMIAPLLRQFFAVEPTNADANAPASLASGGRREA